MEKSTKKVSTVYEIYGKMGKRGKYQRIGTTKDEKVRTKYKYVKVKPVNEWGGVKQDKKLENLRRKNACKNTYYIICVTICDYFSMRMSE